MHISFLLEWKNTIVSLQVYNKLQVSNVSYDFIILSTLIWYIQVLAQWICLRLQSSGPGFE